MLYRAKCALLRSPILAGCFYGLKRRNLSITEIRMLGRLGRLRRRVVLRIVSMELDRWVLYGPPMPAESARESQVVKAVKATIHRAGGWCVKTNGPGTPDILACVAGRFLAIECKRNGDSSYGVTPLQTANLIKIRRAGGLAMVCRDTVRLEVVIRKLQMGEDVDVTMLGGLT